MVNQFSRTELLMGKENIDALKKFRVAVFGIGGVGSYAAEALVRGGIGTIDIIDNDRICLSNINRQLYATHRTIGEYKVDVAEKRIKELNPQITVNTYKTFYTPETADEFNFSQYDYIIDAIDTVAGKIALAVNAQKVGTPIISAMGAGNKTDPTAFRVADIYETAVCPLARVMRTELKKRNIKRLKVVYSREIPLTPAPSEENSASRSTDGAVTLNKRRQTPGSMPFVPPVVGFIIAGEVIKDLTGFKGKGFGA